MVSALGWIAHLVYREHIFLIQSASQIDFGWLGVSLILGVLTVAPSALIFHLIFSAQTIQQNPALAEISKLYFLGQLAKHLPGKVWGVVYQLNELRGRYAANLVVKVNFDFSIFHMAFNVSISSGLIAGYQFGVYWGLGLFLLGSLLTFALARARVFSLFLKTLERFLLLLGKDKNLSSGMLETNYSPRQVVQIFCIKLFTWGMYLLAWSSFQLVFPLMPLDNLIFLCATYTLAWLVGFLSMITPSGIGVRESAFILFSSTQVEFHILAFLAVFVRIWLTLIDLMLVTISYTYFKFYRKELGGH